jgi:CBS domain-containing protein
MDVVHAAQRGELASPASETAAGAPLAIAETAGLDRAAELMVDHGSAHMVAVGPSGLPTGVVSALDVLRAVS